MFDNLTCGLSSISLFTAATVAEPICKVLRRTRCISSRSPFLLNNMFANKARTFCPERRFPCYFYRNEEKSRDKLCARLVTSLDIACVTGVCSPDGTTIAKKKDGIFCVRFIILDCTARSHFPPPFSSHCQYGGSKNIYQTSSALVLCWSRTERETAICISSDRFRHNGDINKPRNE